jgi:hypothetical protein
VASGERVVSQVEVGILKRNYNMSSQRKILRNMCKKMERLYFLTSTSEQVGLTVG